MTESELIQTILVRGARIEERIISLSDKIDRFIRQQEINTEKIHSLETFQIKTKTVMSIMGAGLLGLGSWIGYLFKAH